MLPEQPWQEVVQVAAPGQPLSAALPFLASSHDRPSQPRAHPRDFVDSPLFGLEFQVFDRFLGRSSLGALQALTLMDLASSIEHEIVARC